MSLTELLASTTNVAALVENARYGSEKNVDPFTARWNGEAARQLELYNTCLARLDELGHNDLVRLFRQEHTSRVKTSIARQAVDRAVMLIGLDEEE